MDKITYLKQLETALRKKYPAQQVRDILSDYEDFFTSGMAEGKSEAELCEEFGPPEHAACELKSESETDTPKNKRRTQAIACTAFAVLLVVVFLWPFFGSNLRITPGWNIPSERAVDLWLGVLFPLALEGSFVLWASQSVPRKKSLNWVPRTNIILAVPVTAVLILFSYFIYMIPTIFFGNEGSLDPWHLYITITYYGFLVSTILLLASITLLMLYSIHGHKKAHWFLFLYTTLLVVLLNLFLFAGHIGPDSAEYVGVNEIAFCFLRGILPNLAAAGVTWVILKIISVRKASARRTDSSNLSEIS